MNIITNINLSYIGTDTFIKDTPGILQLCQTVTTPTCNKDIGEGNKLRMWSRGHFFIVRCSGHIDQWHPIYRLDDRGVARNLAMGGQKF